MKIYFIVLLFIPFIYYSWGADPSNKTNPNIEGLYYVNHSSDRTTQERNDNSTFSNSSISSLEDHKVDINDKDFLFPQDAIKRFKKSRFISSVESNKQTKPTRLQIHGTKYHSLTKKPTKTILKKSLKYTKNLNSFGRKNSKIGKLTSKILSIINPSLFQRYNQKFSGVLYEKSPAFLTANDGFISKSIEEGDICKILKNRKLNLTFIVKDCTRRKSNPNNAKDVSSDLANNRIFENSSKIQSFANNHAHIDKTFIPDMFHTEKEVNPKNTDLRTCVYAIRYQHRGFNGILKEFPEIRYEVSIPKNVESADDELIKMLGNHYLKDMEKLQFSIHKNSSLFKSHNSNEVIYMGLAFLFVSFLLLGIILWYLI